MISLSEKTRRKQLLLALVVSVATYLLFFFLLLQKDMHFGGSDAIRSFYPSRYYLYESLKSGHFPFWTEKIFSGFPIYADSERGYLNPLNIVYIMVFGPFTSYKIMHLSFYLLGSLSLFLYLRRKGFKLIGFFVANIIYYFSFFQLFHIQHFTFMPATFLLPTGIYLFDTYILRKQFKWLLFHLLLTVILVYFGSFQSIVLFLLANFLYFFVFAKGKFSMRSQLLMLTLYLFSVVLSSAPQLLPSVQLYLLTDRFSGNQIFTQGSFNPLMLVNLVYPYFFGINEAYKWNMVSGEFFIHETYIYVGIASAILAFLGFLTFKDIRLKRFLVGLAIIFALLGFIGYLPLFSKIALPIVGWFRYWGRSVVLLNFAVAVFAAYFVSFPRRISKKDIFENKSTILGFLVYFSALVLINYNHQTMIMTVKQFFAGAFVLNNLTLFWFLVFFVTLSLLFFFMKSKDKFQINLIVLLLVVDLFIFGLVPTVSYLDSKEDIFSVERKKEMELYSKKRIAYYSPKNFWNMNLYYDSWGVLGYSQYVPKSYIELLKSGNIHGGKRLDDRVDYRENLRDLGVSKSFYNGKVTTIISQNENDLVPNFKGLVFNSIREEGHFRFILLADELQEVETKIRNYPGWEIYIDGEKHEFSNAKDAVYLSFFVPENESEVTLKFVPKAFYVGLALAALGVLGVIALAYTHYLVMRRKI